MPLFANDRIPILLVFFCVLFFLQKDFNQYSQRSDSAQKEVDVELKKEEDTEDATISDIKMIETGKEQEGNLGTVDETMEESEDRAAESISSETRDDMGQTTMDDIAQEIHESRHLKLADTVDKNPQGAKEEATRKKEDGMMLVNDAMNQANVSFPTVNKLMEDDQNTFLNDSNLVDVQKNDDQVMAVTGLADSGMW